MGPLKENGNSMSLLRGRGKRFFRKFEFRFHFRNGAIWLEVFHIPPVMPDAHLDDQWHLE